MVAIFTSYLKFLFHKDLLKRNSVLRGFLCSLLILFAPELYARTITIGSASVAIVVSSVGGTISPAFQTVCKNASPGILTLSGNMGPILRWESSTDGGTTWDQISNTSTTQTYSTIQNIIYRAVIQNGASIVYSKNAVVNVIPAYPLSATASPSTICSGETSTLSATSEIPVVEPAFFETFDQANPKGWQVTENGTIINLTASGNNTVINPWSETNPKMFNGVLYNNLQTFGKFAIASDVVYSLLETPIFSTVGMSSASLDFYQAFNFSSGTVGKIEISTDGGATYNAVLEQYIGPQNLGDPTSLWDHSNIDLSDYMGLSNLRIRFNYSGTAGSVWAIDGMGLQLSPQSVTYVWTPATSLTPSDGIGQTVMATPTTTTTYTVTAMIGGCPNGTQDVELTVIQLPVVTTANSCIGGGAVTFTQTGAAAGGT